MQRASELGFWTDHKGITREVIRHKGVRLIFKYPAHAALRAYIFHRDSYACRECGRKAINVPEDYSGRHTLMCQGTMLVLDHVLSINRGGTHHPDNLQALCDPCNARKAVLVEGAGGAHG